jgi:putative nucleotidyltransferase with HDIG domain
MAEYNMPANIKQHSIIVCEIALCLAQELNKKGETLNLSDIEAAALLHDITKVRSIITRENHALTGAQVLRDLGYERIAEIIKAHIATPDMRCDGSITEEEIVNYADKRVKHIDVVTLDERYADLIARYGRTADAIEYIKKLKQKIRSIEETIFTKLQWSPDDLSIRLSKK